MWIRKSAGGIEVDADANERYVQWNWIAILSYTASLAVSLAIWDGLYRAVERLVK
jgi:hypothetical protein